ncbi:histidine phosphatase family protein [Bacillus solimangrovi]|uniref:Phosphatase n=1 Tax=Bacillus solimangrovi TaxID=1305675 RepID=A0A1E5LEF3_9BACI|nr:histidine phosphatase family protein [Bacillus solimangrovi]OEH92453.1 hypothetical protein BFG57_15850 [Bacillus solimangrovi]
MTEICFVRHGQTDWNIKKKIQGTTQTVLNERGILEARLCAIHLQAKKWDRVITSPLLRAVQTAEIINEQLRNLPITYDDCWIERDYGIATGWTYEKMISAYQAGEIHDIEENEHISKRVQLGLEKLLTLYRNERIIVISHGVTIVAALNIGLAHPLPFEKIHLQNGSLNVMKHKNNKWKVESYNELFHMNAHC